jgi:hypothetical protein
VTQPGSRPTWGSTRTPPPRSRPSAPRAQSPQSPEPAPGEVRQGRGVRADSDRRARRAAGNNRWPRERAPRPSWPPRDRLHFLCADEEFHGLPWCKARGHRTRGPSPVDPQGQHGVAARRSARAAFQGAQPTPGGMGARLLTPSALASLVQHYR